MIATVIRALNLSEKGAEKRKPDIERYIETARLDLIRVGCSKDFVNSENALVKEAIVTYCMAKLGDESQREAYMEAYKYQADNLRKSKKLMESQTEETKSECNE